MDKKIHTDNSEIFETEDIDETEPEETDQTDEDHSCSACCTYHM